MADTLATPLLERLKKLRIDHLREKNNGSSNRDQQATDSQSRSTTRTIFHWHIIFSGVARADEGEASTGADERRQNGVEFFLLVRLFKELGAQH